MLTLLTSLLKPTADSTFKKIGSALDLAGGASIPRPLIYPPPSLNPGKFLYLADVFSRSNFDFDSYCSFSSGLERCKMCHPPIPCPWEQQVMMLACPADPASDSCYSRLICRA